MRRFALLLGLTAVLASACAGGDPNGETEDAALSGRLVIADEGDLFVVNADGSQRRAVVRAEGMQFDADWSPDGREVVYRDSSGEQPDELYSVAVEDSGRVNLTRDPAGDWSPAWSPDGAQIAFASDREGELRIFVMGADGSGVRRVTEIWGEYPAWSPDGEQIAFASYAGGTGPTGDPNYDLFVVNTDASGLRRLTEGPAYDMYPTWSPDGARIAFESTRATPADFEGPARDPERTADFDVFVVDADGGEPENLSRDVHGLQKFPDWSPDGRWLAVDEEGVVAFVPADGSGPIRRPAGDALRGGFPAWAPAG